MKINNEYKDIENDIIEYIKDFLGQVLPMIQNDRKGLIKQIKQIINSDDFKNKFKDNVK